MASRTNVQLWHILNEERDDYVTEALEAAEHEFVSRNIPEEELHNELKQEWQEYNSREVAEQEREKKYELLTLIEKYPGLFIGVVVVPVLVIAGGVVRALLHIEP